LSGERSDEIWLSERRLKRNERGVAALSVLLFVGLLVLGRKKLLQWDADSVAVIADAATAAAAIGIPLALIAGGKDLVAWVARIIARALRDLFWTDTGDERAALISLLPSSAGSAARQSKQNRTSHTPSNLAQGQSGLSAEAGNAAIVLVVVAVLSAWIWLAITKKNSDALPPVASQAASHATPPALPSFCSVANGVVECLTNRDAVSPETIGRLVCKRSGQGWRIYRESVEANGYSFDHRHIPVGTRLTVSCAVGH
jgi:hypothetical protein